MKRVFVATALWLTIGCSNGGNTRNTSDSTVNTAAPGNSDGSNTIGADTAHIDTSLGKIKSDSAK